MQVATPDGCRQGIPKAESQASLEHHETKRSEAKRNQTCGHSVAACSYARTLPLKQCKRTPARLEQAADAYQSDRLTVGKWCQVIWVSEAEDMSVWGLPTSTSPD